MGRDRIIEAYIQRLLAWEKPVTHATLAAIAEEVGITDAELEAINNQAQAHLTRGRAYIEFGCVDDAVKELNQAANLDPLNLEVLHSLANVYNLRHNRTKDATDRQRSLLVARRCVELKPDDKEALVLISFLEHNPAKGPKNASQWTRQKVALLAGGAATVGIGLMGVSRLPMFSKPPAPMGPAPGTIVPGSALYASGDATQAAADTAASTVELDFSADVDIPVFFDHAGLVLEARLSELGDYENEVYYQLQGIFINASDQEFRRLALNVEFLDRNDVAIASTSKEAIATSDAIIRPGDTHTFNLLQKIPSDLASVRLGVTHLEQAPARRTYVPPTPINYSWESLESDSIRFELASRSEDVGVSDMAIPTKPDNLDPTANTTDKTDADQKKPPTGPNTFNAEWVIINTSDVPIQKLKLEANFYSANDRLLQKEDILAIQNNDAPLLPGEIRPFRVIKPIVSGYTRYQVTVVEAE
ncbi:hypothetical protein D0962_15555 [Leptolyngbyaceae cyanobacterium CCMR0082]|uniref:Uncharacterized protein n=1 Tax=Adonisia turfae CCMR0082 TaxID=2304604 RepID=A0A6M0S6T3_9CYAN|nr:hypothetical protein [Adonisia turfae]MDV3351039.1 hypothetical protein [Leptothoe sp. LEGE 181152]NEZ64188.1 hypothetical protein [Adonisia turfae CCMR0082]